MKNDMVNEICARLTVQRFLFEVIQANWFAAAPNAQANFEAFREDFLDRLKYNARVAEDTEFELDIQTKALEYAAKYFDGLEDRLKSILG